MKSMSSSTLSDMRVRSREHSIPAAEKALSDSTLDGGIVSKLLYAICMYALNDIRIRKTSVREKWQRLKDLVAQRRTRLEDAAESHQVTTR